MSGAAVSGRGRFGADAEGSVGSSGSWFGVSCEDASFTVRLREASCPSASIHLFGSSWVAGS